MATYGHNTLDLSLVAGADLTAARFHIVKLDTQGNVVLCNSADDLPIGILQNAPRKDEVASVRALGVSRLVAGQGVSVGAEYGTNDAGAGVAKVAAGDIVMGQVLTGTSQSGELMTVTVNCLSLARTAV